MSMDFLEYLHHYMSGLQWCDELEYSKDREIIIIIVCDEISFHTWIRQMFSSCSRRSSSSSFCSSWSLSYKSL